MKLEEVLGSPKQFEVFYSFVIKWDKAHQLDSYSAMVEFLELIRGLDPLCGKCARSFFPNLVLTKPGRIAFVVSKFDSLPRWSNLRDEMRFRYKQGHLEDTWFHLLYANVFDEVQKTAWLDFVRSDEDAIQADLPAKASSAAAAQLPQVSALASAPSSSAASPTSAVAGVAVAPATFQDKPGPTVLTRENAELLLKGKTQVQLQNAAQAKVNVAPRQAAPNMEQLWNLEILAAVGKPSPRPAAVARVTGHHRRAPLNAIQQAEICQLFRQRGKCVPEGVVAGYDRRLPVKPTPRFPPAHIRLLPTARS